MSRQRGAAVVDFVLILTLLIPLVLGLLQVSLVLFVRNTLASAAAEGARYAGTSDHGLPDGVNRTREELSGVLSARYADDISATTVLLDGAPAVEIVVHATVPALGIGGPGVELTVTGHAVQERP
ncbi:MAG: pilus assembly protein [Nocardioides sp.]|uniref:TadE family protein n=1 Tax=Nocardioides sp. TaxID=35761 RepID=UPI0039E2D901